jgi:hypothetical protein
VKASTPLKVVVYVLISLVTLVRVVVAFPLLLVVIGAMIANDEDFEERVGGWIDRIVGLE